jgi:hypothetical protein
MLLRSLNPKRFRLRIFLGPLSINAFFDLKAVKKGIYTEGSLLNI